MGETEGSHGEAVQPLCMVTFRMRTMVSSEGENKGKLVDGKTCRSNGDTY